MDFSADFDLTPKQLFDFARECEQVRASVACVEVDEQVDVAIDDEQAALRQRAEREGISMQDAARRAVRDYIAHGEHRDRVAAAAERVKEAHAEALKRLGD
jgi:hypothetical protein